MTDPMHTSAGSPASALKPDRPHPLAGNWRVDPLLRRETV